MQTHCKPAGLEDQGLKTEPGSSLNSCKYTVNQVVWTIRIRKVRFPKLNSHRKLEVFVDICLILDDQDPKSEIYKIKFASWIRGFCRHLSFWTIRTRKVRFPKLNSHRELGAFVDICIILFFKFDFGRWPVLIGLIGPIRSFFSGPNLFRYLRCANLFHFHNSVGSYRPVCQKRPSCTMLNASWAQVGQVGSCSAQQNAKRGQVYPQSA